MTFDTVCSYMHFNTDSLRSSIMASIILFLISTTGSSWDHWSTMSSLSKLLGQSMWPCNSPLSFLQQYIAHTTLVQSLFLQHRGEAWPITDNWNPPMHTFHIHAWTAKFLLPVQMSHWTVETISCHSPQPVAKSLLLLKTDSFSNSGEF